MIAKIILFTLIQFVPIYFWVILLRRKQIKVDWRLVISYFIIGSWFGMFGELFLYKLIDWVFHFQIWEYRTLPIHNGVTSSFGVIMWGNAAIYVCFHKHYQLYFVKKRNILMSFILESGYLLILELIFNFTAYGIFNEYFFYYFVPDLMHWSSFTNMPFWWAGYQIMVKYAKVMYRQEKLNLAIAFMMIVIAFAYQ